MCFVWAPQIARRSRAAARAAGGCWRICLSAGLNRYTFTDTDGDGTIDELELREFLVKKRKEGVLRKDIDLSLIHI